MKDYKAIHNDAMDLVESFKLPIIPLCSWDHSHVDDAHAERCQSPGKSPTLKEWSKRTHTIKREIKSWIVNNPHLNIGLVLGATNDWNLVGIDIDGDAGMAHWQDMTFDKEVPPTWEFVTGGGGVRLLYKLPDGCKSKKKKEALDGDHQEVAFIAQGQQTCLPPSIHPSGELYMWCESCSPWDMPEPAMAPQWIIDKVTQKDNYLDNAGEVAEKSKKVTAHEIQAAGGKITTNRTNHLMERLGSFVRTSYMTTAPTMERCIEMAMPMINDYAWDLPGGENDIQYAKNQVISFISNKWVAEATKAAAKAQKEEDKELMSEENLAKFFILKMREEGFFLEFNKERKQIAIAHNSVGPWKYVYQEELYPLAVNLISKEYGSKIATVSKIKNVLEQTIYQLKMGTEGAVQALFRKQDDFSLQLMDNSTIVVENGVIDVATGKLKSWNPVKYHHAYSIQANWQSVLNQEYANRWQEVLRSWIPEEEARLFIQEYMGYCLTPVCNHRAWVFLSGSGRNGKSIFIELVSNLFGDSKAIVEPSELGEKFGTSNLADKLLYMNTDIESSYIKKPGKLKNMIAGENITVENKGKDKFEMKPFGKFLLAANDLPKSSDKNDSWYSRMQIVHFPNKFDIDPEFKAEMDEKFRSEDGKAVLLAWAVEGLQRLINNKSFTVSPDMLQRKELYKMENDTVAEFLATELLKVSVEDVTDLGKGKTSIKHTILYEAYKDWCTLNHYTPVSSKKLKTSMSGLGCEYAKVRFVINGKAVSADGLLRYKFDETTEFFASFGNSIKKQVQ
ncbi:MAG: phage/plasmid primase, P4 family [Cellulosilyticaceae bacterium]